MAQSKAIAFLNKKLFYRLIGLSHLNVLISFVFEAGKGKLNIFASEVFAMLMHTRHVPRSLSTSWWLLSTSREKKCKLTSK